jgi:DNA-binding transcriptional ArsR family regulator
MDWRSRNGGRSVVPSHFQIDLTSFLYFAKYRTMNLVFKALSDPTRRQILHLLRKKPMTAGALAEHFSLAKPTLSGHFAVLREADLIEASKSGTVITYMLKVSVLEEALLAFAETVGIGLPKPMPLKKATVKAK